MGKILSLSNQKGGTSKSSSAVNLGAALKMKGKKVLIVDLDPQGDASTYLGYEEESSDTISQMMERFVRGEYIDLHNIIQVSEKNDGVEYLPADISLAGAEMYLVSVMSRETVLKRMLATNKKTAFIPEKGRMQSFCGIIKNYYEKYQYYDETKLLNAVIKGGVEVVGCCRICEEVVSVAVLDEKNVTSCGVIGFD